MHDTDLVHVANGLGNREHPASHRSRVHTQRAAYAAGNAFEKFETADGCASSFDSNILQPCARAAANPDSVYRDLTKIGMAKANDDAANPAISNQQIRATAEHHERPVMFAAKHYDLRQV